MSFFITTKQELIQKEIDQLDVILISGDAYIDHPSFGIAIIGKVLESQGFTVGIIAQPKTDNNFEDFKKLGKPKLFWGISSGNMDSIVANYTANKKVRNFDAYSEKGEPFYIDETGKTQKKRPDRATTFYAQTIKRLFKNTTIVLGGIEASLRRFVHYDYLQDKLRHSILIETKADILVYGMAEKSIIEIANRLKNEKPLENIKGTAIFRAKNSLKTKNIEKLPGIKEINQNKTLLVKQFDLIQKNMIFGGKTLVEEDGAWEIIQYPPQKALSTEEIDKIYSLNFERKIHHSYKNIPAFEMVKNSITAHRGCFGGCSFCAIGLHQGKIISSRSKKSILKEVTLLKNSPNFKGHITDIGGPSADMFGAYCNKFENGCSRPSCLFPSRCQHLKTAEEDYLEFLNQVSKKVKKVSIGSGLRLDLSMQKSENIKNISENFLSGILKVAPEHIGKNVLKYMQKFQPGIFEEFVKKTKKIKLKNKIIIRPYFIVGHPGETKTDNQYLTSFLKQTNINTEAVQEFVPTPMTRSTALFFASTDETGKKIVVPSSKERKNYKNNVVKLNKFNISKKRKKG